MATPAKNLATKKLEKFQQMQEMGPKIDWRMMAK
jgi:hypothetical protein